MSLLRIVCVVPDQSFIAYYSDKFIYFKSFPCVNKNGEEDHPRPGIYAVSINEKEEQFLMRIEE